MALYDIRAKLRQQDNSGLNKAREKIAALSAKQQQQAKERNEGTVSAPPGSKPGSHYTYPKQS